MSTHGDAGAAGGLRAQRKAERRDRILQALLRLLASRSDEQISNVELAERAGVTPPTIYNLVGNRSRALVMLLNALMREAADHVGSLSGLPPLERAERLGDFLVERLTDREEAYRQVVRKVNALDLRQGAAYDPRPLDLLLPVAHEAVEAGCFSPGVSPSLVARRWFYALAGAMVTWSVGALDARQFAAEATLGFHSVVAALGADPLRSASLARLGSDAPGPSA